MSFANDISKFAKKTERDINVKIRKVGIVLYSSLVRSSPVDIGRFRASWQATIGTLNQTVHPISREMLNRYAKARRDGIKLSPSIRADTRRAVTNFAIAKAGDTLHISNALPYAERMADGWGDNPQQAAGWVDAIVEGVRRQAV